MEVNYLVVLLFKSLVWKCKLLREEKMSKGPDCCQSADFCLVQSCACVCSESLGRVQNLKREVKWLQTTKMCRLLPPCDGFETTTVHLQLWDQLKLGDQVPVSSVS